MLTTTLRLAAVTVAALPVLLVSASPVLAGQDFVSRTTGLAATTEWTQSLGSPDDPGGNVHLGSMYAFETSSGKADVFAFVVDFRCPEATYPEVDEHGGDVDNGCRVVGARQLRGEGVRFSVTGGGSSARLQGVLVASTAGDPETGEGSTPLGEVPVDVSWAARGKATRSSSTYRYCETDGGCSRGTFRVTTQQSAMSGDIGSLPLQEAHEATGAVERFSSSSRHRS